MREQRNRESRDQTDSRKIEKSAPFGYQAIRITTLELVTLVLDTLNPDPLYSISTYNLRALVTLVLDTLNPDPLYSISAYNLLVLTIVCVK